MRECWRQFCTVVFPWANSGKLRGKGEVQGATLYLQQNGESYHLQPFHPFLFTRAAGTLREGRGCSQ